MFSSSEESLESSSDEDIGMEEESQEDAPPEEKRRRVETQKAVLPKSISDLYDAAVSCTQLNTSSIERIVLEFCTLCFSDLADLTNPILQRVAHSSGAVDQVTLLLCGPLVSALVPSLMTPSYPVLELVQRIENEVIVPVSERIPLDDPQMSELFLRCIRSMAGFHVASFSYGRRDPPVGDPQVSSACCLRLLPVSVSLKWNCRLEGDAIINLLSVKLNSILGIEETNEKMMKEALNRFLDQASVSSCAFRTSDLDWLVDWCDPQQAFRLSSLFEPPFDSGGGGYGPLWKRTELISFQVLRALRQETKVCPDFEFIQSDSMVEEWAAGNVLHVFEILSEIIQFPEGKVLGFPVRFADAFPLDALSPTEKALLALSEVAAFRTGIGTSFSRLHKLELAVVSRRTVPMFCVPNSTCLWITFDWCFEDLDSSLQKVSFPDGVLHSLLRHLPDSLLPVAASSLIHINGEPSFSRILTYPRTSSMLLERLRKRGGSRELLRVAHRVMKNEERCPWECLPILVELSNKKVHTLSKIVQSFPVDCGSELAVDFHPVGQILRHMIAEGREDLPEDFLLWACGVAMKQIRGGHGRKFAKRDISPLWSLLPPEMLSDFGDECIQVLRTMLTSTPVDSHRRRSVLECTLTVLTSLSGTALTAEKSDVRTRLFISVVVPTLCNDLSLDPIREEWRTVAILNFFTSLYERGSHVELPESVVLNLLTEFTSIVEHLPSGWTRYLPRTFVKFLFSLVSSEPALLLSHTVLLCCPLATVFSALLKLSPLPVEGRDVGHVEEEVCRALNMMERIFGIIQSQHWSESQTLCRYLLTSTIDAMSEHIVTPDIKTAATMCINTLFAVADERADTADLQYAMSPGTLDLFRKLYRDYSLQKFRKKEEDEN